MPSVTRTQAPKLNPYTVALYNLANNGQDESANGYHLTTNGTPTYNKNDCSNPRIGNSAGPFSTTYYYTMPAALVTRLSLAGLWSIEFGLKIRAFRSFSQVLTSNGVQLSLGTSDNQLRWNSDSSLLGGSLSLGTCYQVAFVASGAQNRSIYLDNARVANDAGLSTWTDSRTDIGTRTAATSFWYDGNISKIRVSIYPTGVPLPNKFPTLD